LIYKISVLVDYQQTALTHVLVWATFSDATSRTVRTRQIPDQDKTSFQGR
jgi:hypothetical protein